MLRTGERGEERELSESGTEKLWVVYKKVRHSLCLASSVHLAFSDWMHLGACQQLISGVSGHGLLFGFLDCYSRQWSGLLEISLPVSLK